MMALWNAFSNDQITTEQSKGKLRFNMLEIGPIFATVIKDFDPERGNLDRRKEIHVYEAGKKLTRGSF